LEQELIKVKKLLEESKSETNEVLKLFDNYKSEQSWAKVKVGGISFAIGFGVGLLFYAIEFHNR
jgi:ElaB/YqjD/DUF883 family membrane-anchored ribosome-binding protein